MSDSQGLRAGRWLADGWFLFFSLRPPVEAEAPPSTQVVQTPTSAQVRYTPTLQQQTSSSPKGLNADFVIHYDVELTDLMGDVQVRETSTQAYNGHQPQAQTEKQPLNLAYVGTTCINLC